MAFGPIRSEAGGRISDGPAVHLEEKMGNDTWTEKADTCAPSNLAMRDV